MDWGGQSVLDWDPPILYSGLSITIAITYIYMARLLGGSNFIFAVYMIPLLHMELVHCINGVALTCLSTYERL